MNGRLTVPMSARDFLSVLFKYKKMIAALVTLTLLIVIAFSYASSESYEAHAKLLIKFGRENTPASATIDSLLRQQLTTTVMRREDVASEVEVLTGRTLTEEALRAVGMERMAPPLVKGEGVWGALKYHARRTLRESMRILRETLVSLGLTQEVTDEQRLILAVQRQVTGTPIRNTDVIDLTFRWPLKEPAAEFVNRLIDLYIARHLSVHTEKGFYGFVKSQVEDARKKLEDAEKALGDYRQQSGIVSLGEQQTILLKQRAEVDSSLQAVHQQIVELKSKLELVRDDVAQEKESLAVDQGSGRNPVIDALRLRMATLELEEKDLLRRFDAGNRLVQEKREAISELRQRLDAEINSARQAASGGSSSLYTTLRQDAMSMEAELAGAVAKETELQAMSKTLTQRLLDLANNETALDRLTRDVKVQEGLFQIYSTKQEELRLADLMDQSRLASITVIEPANTPIEPVRMLRYLPNRILNILAALLGSLTAGVVLSLLRDHFDRTLDTVHKVESYSGLRVVCSLPKIKKGADASPSQLAPLMALLGDIDKPLVISSATADEGVSTTIQKLAEALVRERGKRIVVVDANYRAGAEQAAYRGPSKRGMSDIAADRVDSVVQRSDLEGLCFVARGETAINPPQLLEQPDYLAALMKLQNEFDYVLVDAPPILSHSDAAVLGRHGLPMIVVVDARRTRAEVLNEAKNRVANAQGKIYGVILNFRRFYLPGAIYRRV